MGVSLPAAHDPVRERSFLRGMWKIGCCTDDDDAMEIGRCSHVNGTLEYEQTILAMILLSC